MHRASDDLHSPHNSSAWTDLYATPAFARGADDSYLRFVLRGIFETTIIDRLTTEMQGAHCAEDLPFLALDNPQIIRIIQLFD